MTRSMLWLCLWKLNEAKFDLLRVPQPALLRYTLFSFVFKTLTLKGKSFAAVLLAIEYAKGSSDVLLQEGTANSLVTSR